MIADLKCEAVTYGISTSTINPCLPKLHQCTAYLHVAEEHVLNGLWAQSRILFSPLGRNRQQMHKGAKRNFRQHFCNETKAYFEV